MTISVSCFLKVTESPSLEKQMENRSYLQFKKEKRKRIVRKENIMISVHKRDQREAAQHRNLLIKLLRSCPTEPEPIKMSFCSNWTLASVPALNWIRFGASQVALPAVKCPFGWCEPGTQLSLCCLSHYFCAQMIWNNQLINHILMRRYKW